MVAKNRSGHAVEASPGRGGSPSCCRCL